MQLALPYKTLFVGFLAETEKVKDFVFVLCLWKYCWRPHNHAHCPAFLNKDSLFAQ